MYQKIIHKRYQRRRFGILALVAAALLSASWMLWQYGVDLLSRSSNYDEMIREAARRNCVDPLLVKAVIWRESRFDRSARGSRGEVGLMQIMPEWAATDWAEAKGTRPPGVASLYMPALNIEIGSWYLAKGLRKWSKYRDREALALAEYNAGAKAANKWRPPDFDGDALGRIDYASTRSYVSSIISKYEEYAVNREAE